MVLSRLQSISPATAVFFLLLSVYWITGQGSIQTSDGTHMYLLAQSLVEDGSLSIVNPDQPEERIFSKYGLGLSLIAVPLVALGKILAGVTGLSPHFTERFCVSMINAPVVAWTATLIVLFAQRRMACRPATAVLLGLAFGLSTIAWVYSEDFMSEPVTTLLLFLAVYRITDPEAKPSAFVWAGIWFGLAGLCRSATMIAGPGFLLYIFWNATQGIRLHNAIKNSIRFCLPIAGTLLIIFVYNYVRFSNVLNTGYKLTFDTPLFSGLYGLLFSPGRSLFLFNPVTIAGVLAFLHFFKTSPRNTVLFLTLIASHLLLYAKWTSWHGGLSWGPRFLLVILPYLILPLGAFWESTSDRVRRGIVALILCGIIIQIPAVSVNMARYYYHMKTLYPEDALDRLHFSPRHTPVIGQVEQMAIVWSRFQNEKFRKNLSAQAVSHTRFTGRSPKEVLDNGLAVNAPNFWWVYALLVGVPWWLVAPVVGALILTALGLGVRLKNLLTTFRSPGES